MASERYEIKLFTSMTDIDTLRNFWQAEQWHPNTDLEFFTSIVEARANVIVPCVLVVLRDGNPLTLLVGRVENTKARLRLGYANLGSIAVRQLAFIEGGLIGERTAEICTRLTDFIVLLVRGRCFDMVSLGQVNVDSDLNQAIKKAFKLPQLCITQPESNHWRLCLPSSWEGFLSSRSRKHQYWLKRLPRVLDKEFSGQWKIQSYSSPDDVVDFIDLAEKVACSTYHRRLGVGFRRDAETLRRLFLEAKRGQLRGYVLFIGNEPKAFWYCYTYKNTLYLAATGYDPDYRKYELGTLLLMEVFQGFCGTEIKNVDFGLGDADYKRRLATEHFAEASTSIFSTTIRGICLYGILSAVGLAIKLARRLLDQRSMAQNLKTAWKRRLSSQKS